jgi:hypothetical protein
MIAGAVALAVACTAAIPAVRRWGTVWGSAVLWTVWLTVGGAIALPVAGAASARSPSGLPVGGQAGRQPGSRAKRQADTSRGTGVAPGRLFAVDVGALREIPLPALVVRFAFGATISVVAGLIGVLAGKAAGGVMLAAPAVLPATLTIIERHEGRGPAVTEVEGAVPGAIALIGFAGVAAASTARIPLGAALLAALATWVAVAIGGYLTLAAIVPSWRQDVRTLAFHRRDAARARRAA